MSGAKTATEINTGDLLSPLNRKTANILLGEGEPQEHEIAKLENSILFPFPRPQKEIAKFDKKRKIVVCRYRGARGRQAASIIDEAGFEDVINLRDGVNR